MKKICLFICLLLIAGCASKDQHIGKYHYIYHYVNGTSQHQIIELKQDKECVLTSDGANFAGKYSVDGNDIEVTSPQGIVNKGKISDDTITMQDNSIFGGNQNKRFVAESANGQLPQGESEPLPPPPPPKPEIPDQYVGVWEYPTFPHYRFTIQKDCTCVIYYEVMTGAGTQKVGQCKVDGNSFEADVEGTWIGNFDGSKLNITQSPGQNAQFVLQKK